MFGNRVARIGAGAALAIGGLIGGLIGGAAVATALSRPAATTYYACLSGGLLSRVQTSSESCSQGQREIVWSQVGPRGARGIRGVAGRQGIQGVAGTQGIQGVAGTPATLPSGSYLTNSGACPMPYDEPLYVLVSGQDVPVTNSLGESVVACPF